jgi:Flp pilus assembly protein TadG
VRIEPAMIQTSGREMPMSRRGSGCLQSLARLIGRVRRDERGIAAVEFGFIAPVLILLLVGAVEVTRAVAIDRRVSVATNMVADLVAREDKPLTKNDIEAIYNVVERVMAPYDATKLKMSLIPVKSSPTDAAKTLVYPEVTNRPSYNGGALPPKCQSYPLPTGLLAKDDSVIVVESKYSFRPMLLGYVMGASEWAEKAYAKPRGSCVVFDGTTCVSSCFSS